MRTIILAIRTIIYLLLAIPDMRKAARLEAAGDIEGFRSLTDARVKDWAQHMLKYAGVTVEVHGKENLTGEPCVFVGNHQSDWDIPIVLACLDKPYGMVAKDTLQKIPLIRTWMKYIGCVFLDRNDARKALKTLADAGSQIPEGRSITIFPEGTRSRGEDIGEFKHGAFKTAFKYNAPIVPLAIDGSYKIMEGNKHGFIKPAHVILTILPAIPTEGMEKAEQKALGDDIRLMIADAREKSRGYYLCNNL